MTLRLKASRSAIFSDAASTITSARRRFSASWPARNATAKNAKTLMPTVIQATSAGGSSALSPPGGTDRVLADHDAATRQALASAAIRTLP